MSDIVFAISHVVFDDSINGIFLCQIVVNNVRYFNINKAKPQCVNGKYVFVQPMVAKC